MSVITNRRRALDYLRSEAIDAHLAGDGMQVLHFCTVGLDHIWHGQYSQLQSTKLSEIRWTLFLSLYWMLNDWLTYFIDDILKKVEIDETSDWDRQLIEFLLQTIHYPLSTKPIDELIDPPTSWFLERSQSVEDVAALTFALELKWYTDHASNEWMTMADSWISRSPNDSLLLKELKRVKERLGLQSAFRKTGSLPNPQQVPSGSPLEERALIEAWKLYYEASFPELDKLLRELANQIRIESYPAFFRAIHFSRMHRRSKESQFLSLSRLHVIESRQPAQFFQQSRDNSFYLAFSSIARSGFANNVATDRFTCFRMSMLNQLYALRSWDIGGWLIAERQHAESLLELAARGEIQFVKPGILSLRNSLNVPDPGKYTHFDLSLQLLDALTEDDRRSLARELIDSPRIAWSGASRILSELSDAIPMDMLMDYARWNVLLELDEYHSRWTLTTLEKWGTIFYWIDDASELVEILKPALLLKGVNHRCWDKLHDTLCGAITKGLLSTARQILETLMTAQCDDLRDNQLRFSILRYVSIKRPELQTLAIEWMGAHVASNPEPLQLFLFRHRNDSDIPNDDKAFRDWIRTSIIEYCKNRMDERDGRVTLGHMTYHSLMTYVTWPEEETELVKNVIELIDSDYVPFSNKSDPIACLAVLVRSGPKTFPDICAAMIRWLETGIHGRDLGQSSPLSTGQVLGMGPDSIQLPFSYLISVLAETHFDSSIGKQLSDWVLTEGSRRPLSVSEYTIRTILFCSIGISKKDQSMSVALIGICEAIATVAFKAHPRKMIDGFSSVVLDLKKLGSIHDWVLSDAGKLCLNLWKKRLSEASVLVSTDAREAVALALLRWEGTFGSLPSELTQVRDRLSKDCRLRVRSVLEAKRQS